MGYVCLYHIAITGLIRPGSLSESKEQVREGYCEVLDDGRMGSHRGHDFTNFLSSFSSLLA